MMKELQEKYKHCSLCKSCQNKTKVFGSGNLSAKIAIVGEGPGKDEISELTPFVGAAGQLLDKILASIKLDRKDLYFTNAVLCRTDDKNRTPTKTEYSNCRDRLFKELSIVTPRYTLLVGSVALKTIFGDNYKISEEHGTWITSLSLPCYFYFALYHPAWILHSSTEGETKVRKKIMWEDIKSFRNGVDTMNDTINWGTVNNETTRECGKSFKCKILSEG